MTLITWSIEYISHIDSVKNAAVFSAAPLYGVNYLHFEPVLGKRMNEYIHCYGEKN